MKRTKGFCALIGSLAVLAVAANQASAAGYVQTNLVTNGTDPAVTALHTDANLVNPWGISFIPGRSPFWVSDNNAGVTTLYDGKGSPFPSPATPFVVDIPLPNMDPTKEGNGGAPTGQVANLTILTNSPGFAIGSFGPALFIFATEDGTIEAWNQTIPEPDNSPNLPVSDDAAIVVNNSAGTTGGGPAGAVYKGLALVTKTINGALLYATNFRSGKIDVFNSDFGPVILPGSFTDPNVQHGYAPFGIQNIHDQLWVTYALQDKARHDPVNKPAHGFVSVFDPDGNLIQHFAQHGHLSSPWGAALAPDSFGQFADDILVGNFGDGTINTFDPVDGHWLGTLSDATGKPIVNPGLWSVTFSGSQGANALRSDPDTLYITAGLLGPTHEEAGLFAKIAPN
jgi:uncharacterized protein (TIGR03118 family)